MTERRGRKRQRSLRVPVDDVPRHAPDEGAELEMLVEPEPAETSRPRSVAPPPPPPPPPPPAALEPDAEIPIRQSEPDLVLADVEPPEARTTDPGISAAPEEPVELGAPMAADVAATELEGEPTHVAPEVRKRARTIEIDPDDDDDDTALPGEPTRELVLPEEPPPPPPRRPSVLPPPGTVRPVTVPPPAGVLRPASMPPPAKPASMPPPAKPASVPPPPQAATPTAPISSPPPSIAAAPATDAAVQVQAVRTSSPGVIVVGRTIAIGVGAPTHTTTAEERKSLPPPEPPRSSQPPAPEPELEVREAEPSEAEAPEVLLDVPVDAPDGDEPVVSSTRDDDDEELAAEELEEASTPGIEAPRSLPPTPAAPPPKPPAAAPAPPAPHPPAAPAHPPAAPAHAPATAAAPPPPPAGARPPPKPPERKAPPSAASAPAASEPDTTKRAKRKWWEELFNDDYLRTVPIPHPRVILRQTDFIEARLGLAKGATVLDVGCGLGLHAIELTRRGYFVVGLDLSLPMLSRAADEARDQGLKINFVQGDMREMNFDGAFDAVVSWGTSFGYFDDDANRAVVERFHRALKPGGLLLLDVVNRDHVLRGQPNNCWFQGDGCIVMEESQLNFITSRLTVKRQVMLDDGRQQDTGYSIRLYSLHELGQILHTRGFRVHEVSGLEATPNVFFGAESPRLLIVAERRPDAPGATTAKKPDGGETGPHETLPGGEPPPAAEPAAPSGNGGGEPH